MAIHQHDDELDDRTVEELLAGRRGGDRADQQPLSTFVAALRSTATAVPPVVRPELASMFESAPEETAVLPAVERVRRSTTRRRVARAVGAFMATVTGKVVIAATAVAVGVGSMHATGVVEVPGLPTPSPTTDGEAPVGDFNPAREDGTVTEDRDDTPRPPAVDEPTDPPVTPDDKPGVDGGSVSDRARDGEAKENGRDFGDSVSDEARKGTPAEDRAHDGDAATKQRKNDSAGDKKKSDADDSDVADTKRPDGPPSGRR